MFVASVPQTARLKFFLLLVSGPFFLASGPCSWRSWVMQSYWWEGLVPVHWCMEQDLVPLVSKVMSRGISRGDHGLRMTLGCLSDDGWGCSTWGILALEPVGWRPGLGAKRATSRRAHVGGFRFFRRVISACRRPGNSWNLYWLSSYLLSSGEFIWSGIQTACLFLLIKYDSHDAIDMMGQSDGPYSIEIIHVPWHYCVTES